MIATSIERKYKMAKPASPDPNDEDALRRKVAGGSASPEDYTKLGGLLFLMGNSQETVTLFRQAIDLAQTNLQKARVCIEFGWVHYEMGQQGEAQVLVQQALGFLATEADRLEVLACRGAIQALLAQLEWAKDAETGRSASRLALEILERVIDEGSEFEGKADAYFDAAVLHSALGSTERAITLCDRYLSYPLHEWERISCLTVFAEALRNAEQFVAAHQKLEEAISYAKKYKTILANLYSELGIVQCHMKLFREAQQTFRQALLALEADPYRDCKSNIFARIHMSLAAAWYELGDLRGAEVAYEEVLNSQPEGSPYYCGAQLGLGRCYQAARTYAKAKTCFERVLASPSATEDETLDAKDYLARNLYESREYRNASVIFQDLLAAYPKDDQNQASIILWLGHCYEGLGDHGKARESYEEVIASPHALAQDQTSALESLRRLPPDGKQTFH